MRNLLVGAMAAAMLAGCSTTQALSAHQTAEKAMILADGLYIAIATTENALVSAGKEAPADAEATKLKAWNALLTARAAYHAGNVVDVTILTTIAAQDGATVHP